MMRLKTYLLLPMVSVALHAGAQGIIVPQHVLDSIANPPVDRNKALVFECESIDVGRLSEDDAPLQFNFPFRNAGTRPLVITRVETTCGCAVAHFDRKPVLPGASGWITVVYNPHGHPGRLLRHIYVYTDSSAVHPSIRLEITGEVTPTEQFTGYPARLGVLAAKRKSITLNMSRKEFRTERIECVNTGEKPLRLRALTNMLPAWLTFRTEPAVIEPGITADLVVTMDGSRFPECPEETLNAILTIDGLEGRPTERSLHIKLTIKDKKEI